MDGSNKRAGRPKSRQSIAHIPSLSRTASADKQNATVDLSAGQRAKSSEVQSTKKKLRGKSLGPGGLEALKETDGNSVKSIPSFQPKSILKPTVPLTPPKNIPTFDELRQRSTRKRSPSKSATEALLIDFSTPAPSREDVANTGSSLSQEFLDPFSPTKPTEAVPHDLDTAKHEVDEQERLRQEHKKTILEQRAARRKSMANRRVSFAPEATLHTWSVMEMVEDSTTSSASNSTRRQSSMTAQQTPQRHSLDAAHKFDESETSTVPSDVSDASAVAASSVRQNDSHVKQRQRSSALSEDVDGSGDEMYSSSPSGDVAAESSPIRVEDSIDSDSDTDGDTAMSMDEMTVASQESSSSTHSSLEERLRQAANQAGTRGIDYDEYGDDISMEIANDTVTNAFKPWAKDQRGQPHGREDQENIDPFLLIQETEQHATAVPDDINEETSGMAMEITQAIGGILQSRSTGAQGGPATESSRRRSSVVRRKSVNNDYIHKGESTEAEAEDESESEITMDFTTAVGRVFGRNDHEITTSIISDGNETMDMTAAVGGILAPIEEQTEPQTDVEDDRTVPMEVTKAVGHILSASLEEQSEDSLSEKNPTIPETSESSNKDRNPTIGTPRQLTSVASETGSPSLTLKSRSSSRTKSVHATLTQSPKSAARSPSRRLPAKEVATPTKQLTPVPTRAKSPERTPVSSHGLRNGASSKKLFQAEIQARASPGSRKSLAAKPQDPIFAEDDITGRQTPRVVLHAPKPHQHMRRRSSGIGIDNEGFGSPSVTHLLSRRSSIGEAAPQFKLDNSTPSAVRFEDPELMAQELEAERLEDHQRESGRFVMEQEANGHQEDSTTLQLKNMINSMSPKKNKMNRLKGRKSLAVGSARGLLGKRPVELDEGEDGNGTPKRLKIVSREGSPVKKIHLPKPPSKEETTGRLSKAEQSALEVQHAKNSSQEHGDQSTTQDVVAKHSNTFEQRLISATKLAQPVDEDVNNTQRHTEDDKISLQQFLNMTNIHFIELNTTKRRHTVAALKVDDGADDGMHGPDSLQACFVAAATTVPLLELYQHATKELRAYISSGRKIIRSIEAETLAEQPLLFREYVDARPDIKLVMDNQFRNGKTSARLQSKEGWYTWRSQLIDGLQGGMKGIRNDLAKDLTMVEDQADSLNKALPPLQEQRDRLASEFADSNQRLDDLNSVDHQVLRKSRKEFSSIASELEEKYVMLKELQRQMHDKNEALAQAAELKEEMQEQISEANKVREEHRGWATKDVLALKAVVDAAKARSGWSLLSAEEDLDDPDSFGVALTMSYKDMLRLFFHPSAYESMPNAIRRRSDRNSQSGSGSTAPISLTVLSSPDEEETFVQDLPTEQRFFLQFIQSQLHAYSMMPKGSISVRSLLDTVSSGWALALKVTEEIRLLSMAGITKVMIQGDEKLALRVLVVLPNKSRVDVEFNLTATVTAEHEVCLATAASPIAVYGPATKFLDATKIRKVRTALDKEVENMTIGEGALISATLGFEDWHRNQMRLQPETEHSETATKEEVDLIGSTTPKSPAPTTLRASAITRSPLAVKKPSTIQKKTIPVAMSRQEKFKTSQREQQPSLTEKGQLAPVQTAKDKENFDPFAYVPGQKPPAITPEMQEAMMQRTPIKRVGALRRSPI